MEILSQTPWFPNPRGRAEVDGGSLVGLLVLRFWSVFDGKVQENWIHLSLSDLPIEPSNPGPAALCRQGVSLSSVRPGVGCCVNLYPDMLIC